MSDDLRRPVTVAGRALLEDWKRGDVLNRLPPRGLVSEQIAAIEDEARGSVVSDNLIAALERLRRHGYQPMYNGRPSCPFCERFIDSEDRHAFGCVLDNGLDRLAASESQREELA